MMEKKTSLSFTFSVPPPTSSHGTFGADFARFATPQTTTGQSNVPQNGMASGLLLFITNQSRIALFSLVFFVLNFWALVVVLCFVFFRLVL